MAARIVILGAGTGGTLTANRLRKALPDVTITVVDENDRHVYQPGLLFVPFGLADPEDIVRPRGKQLHRGHRLPRSPPSTTSTSQTQRVHLADGTTLDYDVLVVATGSRLVPEETEGLTGPGWMEKVFTFYDLDGAAALAAALAGFEGGRLVVNVVDMPIKCPVAPLEFCFLADWYFHERGIRDEVELTYVTPLDGAFTKPTVVRAARRHARRARHRAGHRVQHRRGRRRRRPAHRLRRTRGPVRPRRRHPGPQRRRLRRPTPRASATPSTSSLTDPHTLQSEVAPNIFAIGDAANLPASKAGSVTHFEGEVLVENIKRFLAGEALDGSYDGHANCFIETGFHKAMLIDFNYDTEPVGGHFPTDGRRAAAEGVPPQPPRQADVPVVLLARPAARPRHPRRHPRHAHRRQAPRRHIRTD